MKGISPLCYTMYFLNNSIIKLLAEQKATLQEVQKSMSQMKHDLMFVNKSITKIQKEEAVVMRLKPLGPP